MEHKEEIAYIGLREKLEVYESLKVLSEAKAKETHGKTVNRRK